MIKNPINRLLALFYAIKDANLHWQSANQAQIDQLKHARIIEEQALAAQLAKKSAELAHELSLLQTKHDAELVMYKTRCEQDIKDYKQYLKSLEQLKISIQRSYTQLPEAMAFTIHHHAKQLLNAMWESEDFEEKMRLEMRLIHFMTAVHEDARDFLENTQSKPLPEKTFALIEQQ
jgi:pyruvate formate-lyase activating enzyme-like uncharacterized protein